MATSTVVLAREDLSIHGAFEAGSAAESGPAHVEKHFFNMIEEHRADAVILDLTGSNGRGVAAIRKIRERSAIPVVVLCDADDKRSPAYRRAGAAACLNPPVDLLGLNHAILQAGQPAGLPAIHPGASQGSAAQPDDEAVAFAGLVLHPRDNRLIGPDGAGVTLSTIESQVLLYLVGTAGIIWPAKAIAEAVDGARSGDPDRTVPAVIGRLRKKIGSLAGPAAQRLIKTEMGRGYVFAGEAASGGAAAPAAGAGLSTAP